ncbi:MAG: glycosyltransferase [Eubacterium sp.]|nr:glycosyltransferase [Eubacterium sp.]
MQVSIITPFYHGNSYLERLSGYIIENICSLKEMPDVQLEWILVNDSPDTELNRSRIHPDIPVRILTHTENRGIHQARITGLQASRADWILFLDQDDMISRDMIRNMLRDGSPDQSDVLVCNALCETEQGDTYRLYSRKADLCQVGNLSVYLKITDVICSPGQCLIRRTVIPEEWEQLVMDVNGSDDLMLWIMMLSRKARFSVLPDAYYRHTFTGRNVSGSNEQIGSSSYEAADTLFHSGFLTTYQYHVLKRSILWSLRTRKQNLLHFCQSPDIIAYRICWKIRQRLSAKLQDAGTIWAEDDER